MLSIGCWVGEREDERRREGKQSAKPSIAYPSTLFGPWRKPLCWASTMIMLKILESFKLEAASNSQVCFVFTGFENNFNFLTAFRSHENLHKIQNSGFSLKMWRSFNTEPSCCILSIIYVEGYHSPSAIILTYSFRSFTLPPWAFLTWSHNLSWSKVLWLCDALTPSIVLANASQVRLTHVSFPLDISTSMLFQAQLISPLSHCLSTLPIPEAKATGSWQHNCRAFVSHLNVLYFTPKLNVLASGFCLVWLWKKEVIELPSLAPSQNKFLWSLFIPPFHKQWDSIWVSSKW